MMILGGLGGSRRFGGSGDPQGVCYTPYRALFVPHEVLYVTKFRFKNYIMVNGQYNGITVNVNWLSITDPFLAHCIGELPGLPNGHFLSKINPFGAPNRSKISLFGP